jgi:hypothetical protein
MYCGSGNVLGRQLDRSWLYCKVSSLGLRNAGRHFLVGKRGCQHERLLWLGCSFESLPAAEHASEWFQSGRSIFSCGFVSGVLVVGGFKGHMVERLLEEGVDGEVFCWRRRATRTGVMCLAVKLQLWWD